MPIGTGFFFVPAFGGLVEPMTSTVVPGLSTFRLKPSYTFFGFFAVPESFGVAVAVSVASESLGSTAARPAVVRASVAVAATATVSSLRKGCFLLDRMDAGRPERTARNCV